MDVFQTHAQIINDYATHIPSFPSITDPYIQRVVEQELTQGKLWPEPLLQLNPSFEMTGQVGATRAPWNWAIRPGWETRWGSVRLIYP